LVIVPLMSWFMVKPVRVIAPQWAGVICADELICIDEVARLPEARGLYAEAAAFVSTRIAAPTSAPRLIFCATDVCAASFGLGSRSAVTLGRFGTVIGPGAWKPYYVRHEMIHHLQAEHIGVLRLLLKPSWFVEGMAYTLSEDPRQPLAEPFETDRRLFRKWFESIGAGSLWESAEAL